MKTLVLCGLLALASGLPTAAQQAPGKLKIKTKGGPATATPAAPDLPRTYAASITPEELRQHLTIVASDAFQGREAGQPGQKLAAEYLVKQMSSLKFYDQEAMQMRPLISGLLS